MTDEIRYELFGHLVASTFPLGNFLLSHKKGKAIHISIRSKAPPTLDLKWYHHVQEKNRRKIYSFAEFKSGFLIRMHGVSDFLLTDGGNNIICIPQKKGNQKNLQALLLSFVLPFALTLKGVKILHASCVQIGKGVVLFIGNQGYGKSTLAAAFVKKGHSILSDDAVPVFFSGKKRILARPSYPEIRLSGRNILKEYGPKIYKKSTPGFNSKRRMDVSADFRSRAQPIWGLFFLNEPLKTTQNISISRVNPQDAWVALIKNSFRLDIASKAGMTSEVDFFSRLVETLPIRRITFPRKMHSLPKVVHAILTEVKKEMGVT